MLKQSSVPGPTFKDPKLNVRVLVAMFVGGKEYLPGETLGMLTSDVQFAKDCCVPPRVEIIK
jgi:hypothetical protein